MIITSKLTTTTLCGRMRRSSRALRWTEVCETIRQHNTEFPVNIFAFNSEGEVCTWGEECCYGHYCPALSKCHFLKHGKCKFIGGVSSFRISSAVSSLLSFLPLVNMHKTLWSFEVWNTSSWVKFWLWRDDKELETYSNVRWPYLFGLVRGK